MNHITKRLKSRTYQYLVIGSSVVGIIEANLHILQPILANNYYAVFFVFSVLSAIFREITKEPIDAK